MVWIIYIIVILFFSFSDEIIEYVKNKNPSYHKDKSKKIKLKKEEQVILRENLKEHIGDVCTISSSELMYVNQDTVLSARVLAVDDDWVSLEYITKGFIKKETTSHLLLKMSSIDSFSVLVSKEYINI